MLGYCDYFQHALFERKAREDGTMHRMPAAHNEEAAIN